MCLGVACAHADEFAERCAALPTQVKITVEFQDSPVATDDSRNVQGLNGLSGKPADGRHNVYGLTHAVPYIRMRVAPRAFMNAHGQYCAMPDITVNVGFSQFMVYLATELTDNCRRRMISEHEQEHVNTWKSHLRASAQLLTTVLRRDVGEPRMYGSREEAEAGVRAWGEELVAPWAKRIVVNVRDAQQSIDTPTSYAMVTSRLRTCPPAGRGR